MQQSAPLMTAEIEAIKRAYAALNRNDVAGFVSLFTADVVRVEFEGTPMAGTFRGLTEVTEHVTAGRGPWAEGGCEPQRFVVAGDRVVVLVDVRVRLKTETDWRTGRVADGFAFKDGKAVEFRSFLDEREVMEWAEIRNSGA